MDNFCRKTKKYIEENNLIAKGDRITAALSGGADSVSLLCALTELAPIMGFTVCAAHLHHGIRGESADRDAEFCRKLCDRLGVTLYTKYADIPAIASREKISEELAGRRARYAFFDELAKKHGFIKTATAHNLNDNAETVLMHLMRGSGIKGLCGIAPSRGNVIRPLLCMTRTEIEEFCFSRGLDYVTDETNLETVYTRNKVRLELLPMIERKFNPAFVERTGANSAVIRAEDEYLDICAENIFAELYDGESLDAAALCLKHKAMQRRVLSIYLKRAEGREDNISLSYIDGIIGILGKSGGRIDINNGFSARVSFGRLYVTTGAAVSKDFCVKLEPGRETVIPEAGICALLTEPDAPGAGTLYGGDINSVVIRSKRSGDIFCPAGMAGRKKLKAFMTEKKIPSDKRALVPIVEINGMIADVYGYRRDRRFFGKNMKLIIKRYCNKEKNMI